MRPLSPASSRQGEAEGSAASEVTYRTQVVTLLLLFAVGIGVRIAAVSFLNIEDRYTYDSTGYLEYDGAHPDDREYEGRAWNLVSGGNFWSLPNGDGNAPPGYPFLIALAYSVAGRDLSLILWLNAALGGVASILTYQLGRKAAGHKIGLLAGAFVAADPLLIYWSTRVLPETMTVFLALALLVAAAHMRETNGRVRTALLYGLLVSAAILVRNQLVAVVGATGLWLVATGWRERPLMHGLAYSVALCSVILSAVTVLSVANRPPGTVSQVEQMFDGDWLSARSYVDLKLERSVYENRRKMTPEEIREIGDEASRYVRETPAWKVLLWNWTERTRVFWRMNPGAGNRLEQIVYLGSTASLFALSLVGFITTLSSLKNAPRDRVMLNALLMMTCLAVMILHLLLIAKPRYRLPLHPILWIWASSFLVSLARRTRLSSVLVMR